MRASRTYGSVRGVARNGHPYRDWLRTGLVVVNRKAGCDGQTMTESTEANGTARLFYPWVLDGLMRTRRHFR